MTALFRELILSPLLLALAAQASCEFYLHGRTYEPTACSVPSIHSAVVNLEDFYGSFSSSLCEYILETLIFTLQKLVLYIHMVWRSPDDSSVLLRGTAQRTLSGSTQ